MSKKGTIDISLENNEVISRNIDAGVAKRCVRNKSVLGPKILLIDSFHERGAAE